MTGRRNLLRISQKGILGQFIEFKSARQGSRAGMLFEIFDPPSNHTRFEIGSNIFDNIKLLSQ